MPSPAPQAMNTGSVQVSIIMVAYRDESAIEILLATYAAWVGSSVEFVVVRNSVDPTTADLKVPPNLRVIQVRNTHNAGFARAFNQGLSRSSGGIIVGLNADAELTAGFLEAAALRLTGPKPVVLAPALHNENGVVLGRRFYNPVTLLLSRLGVRGPVYADRSRDVDWVLGACFAIRADVLRKMEGLDERFFLYFEDVDLCWRVWEAGGRVEVIHGLSVHHEHARASSRISRPLLWHIRSGLSFFAKHPRAILGAGPAGRVVS